MCKEIKFRRSESYPRDNELFSLNFLKMLDFALLVSLIKFCYV